MDILSIAGLGCGLAAIIISMTLDGGNLMSLLQLSALIIVGGGTLGAILLQTPMSVFLRSVRMLRWVFFPPHDGREEYLRLITDWLRIARHQFVLALDPIAEQQTDPFLRQGLRLVVDGVDASQIRNVLESVIATRVHEEKLSAETYEAAGGYSPTVGILGAVMGLITVMAHLDDPSELGNGIATAFVATVYGVGSANLLFLPIAGKLKVLVRRRQKALEMVTEGMVGIAIMESPVQLEMRLRAYLEDDDGEERPAGQGEADAPAPAAAE